MPRWLKLILASFLPVCMAIAMNGCSTGAKQGASSGAKTGAVGGLVAGAVGSIFWGGDAVNNALRAGAVGAASGAAVGAMAGSERDKAKRPAPAPAPASAGSGQSADLSASNKALKAQMGDLNFSAGEELAHCRHVSAISRAEKAFATETDPKRKGYALLIEAMAAEESSNTTKADAVYAEWAKFDPSRADTAKLRNEALEGLLKVQKIRQEQGLPRALHMSAIDAIIRPRERDLGGFTVRRVLPAGPGQMVGPFIFFDAMGPATFAPGTGVDVRPHPHIGLATVTWLFEGELLHRDSLGCTQLIRPGEVNWMTAGRGIAHSERTPRENRARPSRLHGIQSWVALPKPAEEMPPEFHHHGAGELPVLNAEGVHLTVIAGTLLGLTSPVRIFSQMGYGMLKLATDARCVLPPEHEERAVYLVDGDLAIDGEALPAGALATLLPGRPVELRAIRPALCMVLGGEPADAPRQIWWNFVSSSTERLERAKQDWKLGRFAAVPGETEFIPLPEQ